MNIIKEGYPSGLLNFSASIIAYLESVITIFLLLTDSHFIQKTGDRSKLPCFNNFKLDRKQVEEKNFEMFHDWSNDKVLRCTCQFENPDEVKVLLEK